MRPFELNMGTLLLRYFLMMALIIAGGFTGQYWLAFFGFVVFLSAIMGVSIRRNRTRQSVARSLPQREKQAVQQAA